MPLLRTATMAAFGLVSLVMLTIAAFAFLSARQPFVGLLLIGLAFVSAMIAVLMWRGPVQPNFLQRDK